MGTAVYMTHIGTAIQRERLSRCGGMVYTVVTNKIIILKCCFNLEKLGFDWSKIYFILRNGRFTFGGK
jgi:hypothetical protein